MKNARQESSRGPTRYLRSVGCEWLVFGLVTVTALGAGCSAKAQVGYIRQARTGIAPDEAVAVIVEGFSGEFSADKEEEFAGCIGDAIRKVHPTLRIVALDEFRRAAFPDLTPAQIPPTAWHELVSQVGFREKIAPLGLRYLISISGKTVKNWGLGTQCGGQGCVLVLAGERHSSLDAAVFDVKQERKAGEVRGAAFGRPVVMIFPPVPVFITAPTESKACQEVGREVARFLTGEPRAPFELAAGKTIPENDAVVFGRIKVVSWGSAVEWGSLESVAPFRVYLLSDTGSTPVPYDLVGDDSFYWHLPPGVYTITGFRWPQRGGTRSRRIYAQFTVSEDSQLIYIGTLTIGLDRDYRLQIEDEYDQAISSLRAEFPHITGEVAKSLMHLEKAR